MDNNKTQKTKKKLRIIESQISLQERNTPPKLNTNNKTVKTPKKRKLNIIESPCHK